MISGYISIFTTVLLWSGFFLSIKGGTHSLLTPADMAMTRFILPAIILFPLVFRAREQILKVPFRCLITMFIGCGLPYLLVVSNGLKYANIVDASALIPGTLPLFVSSIAILLYKQPLTPHKKLGLLLISFGIFLFLLTSLSTSNNDLLYGQLIFLVASLLWSGFTISARIANLHPLVCAGFISLISSICLAILMLNQILDSYLINQPLMLWPWNEITGHTLIQGVGAGLLASFTYLHAINKLGAERTSAYAAATPITASLLAMVFFVERADITTWLILSMICLGGVIASNIFSQMNPFLFFWKTNKKNV